MADKAVSRREFLKIAGIAGATIGVGAGLGGLVAACGGTEETTTTTAGRDHHDGRRDHHHGGRRNDDHRGCRRGDGPRGQGRLGHHDHRRVRRSERAGRLPSRQAKDAIGDGLVCADGKKHPVTWIVKDSQSDTNRAAEVTGELITERQAGPRLRRYDPGGQHPGGAAVRGERRALRHLRVPHGTVVLRHGRESGRSPRASTGPTTRSSRSVPT